MILLTNETVDMLLKSNNIVCSSNENYNNKIQKLKNAGLLNKNDEFYNNDKDLVLKSGSDKDCNCSGQVNKSFHTQIQEYFIDGSYRRVGVAYPTCAFPNGPIYEGNFTIFSNYECNDKTKPFLQKNILGQTLANNEPRVSLFSFNILNNALLSTNTGSSLSGSYYIDGDKLYANYDEGYFSSTGKLNKVQYLYVKTPGGYTLTQSLWNVNQNKYEVFGITQFIRLLL
jgi:hypothetical protein